MNQHEQILDYIKRHGSITQGEASRLGIGRLAARIDEFPKGTFLSERVKVAKADGTTAIIARYSRSGLSDQRVDMSVTVPVMSETKSDESMLFELPAPALSRKH